MSFNPLNTAEIAVGEPVKNTTQTKIKDNLDNLNERIESLEGGSSTTYPPIILRVNGTYGEHGDLQLPANGILKTTLNFNITITGARLIIDEAGVSGTTEIDIKYKRGVGAYTSIFTTKPSVGFASGDDSTSSNGILNISEVGLQAGDIIRLDILDAQIRAQGLMIRLDYIKT